MKKCAIILNGKDIVKVNNLKRKYNKFINNPEIKILEECDEDQLEDRYAYWCGNTSTIKNEEDKENLLKYHWKNKKTGWTISSIYPNLKSIKDEELQDWEPLI